MQIKYTRHAIVDSMPDDKLSRQEVEAAIIKAEKRTRISDTKFKFKYKDIEVVCVKISKGWLVVTVYRC